ncbi:unnamed protein product [Ambrosiozyma monospora]|uniref:Unnamed protein product n=1 Tax=Ambrosiozyma monospora TaxID=43982 RepID=A0A9W6YU76_AMBMO|nr:unnamed protein product [Ambrosiozyma monospora]
MSLVRYTTSRILQKTLFPVTATMCRHSRLLSSTKNLSVATKRYASTITTPNDPKLVNLLSRLEKFDKESDIFHQLDDLYLLTQRKGFFNLNSNNLEFLSNSAKINVNYTNLYNFNNLNQLVSNQYSNMLLLPTSSSSAMPSFGALSDPLGSNIPGLTSFNDNAFANGLQLNRNTPVDKYLKLLNNLAKNDVELKSNIDRVLKSFDKEDDFFFNYVLQFWINGKNFNKSKVKKHQDEINAHNQNNLGL